MKRCQTCNILGGDNQAACYADGQPLIEDPLATTLQDAIGEKYSLTKLIGKGAMGAVYGAHHRDLGEVAIKVMLAQGDNQSLSERFLREARALRKLRHQNAVLIYDLERSPTGVTYMVMEMVAGRSLGQDLRERKRFTLDETMEVAAAVCSALAAAHERGIIHRDLKPDNILRAEEKGIDGRTIRTIKIADFGIVKQRSTGDDDEDVVKLTRYGKPIGTPFYMSPEQWFGDGPGLNALDHRTDIYALGCTLYEMLSGRPPFVGRTPTEMRRQHLHDEPPPLYQVSSQVPQPVSRVIMRALAKDRDERQQSASEFITELHAAYDESFQRTDRRIEERLRSTQESVINEPDAVQASSLTDTEESVPMFIEKVAALDPSVLAVEHESEASAAFPAASIPAVAADGDGELEHAPAALVAPAETPSHVSAIERDERGVEPYSTPTPLAAAAGRPQRKSALIIAIVLLLFGSALTFGVGVYLYRRRQPSNAAVNWPPPVQQKFSPPQIPMGALKGTLRLNAASGSEVFIDDEKAGVVGTDGIFNTEIPVGLRNVRVAASGYRLWQRDARIKANQKTTLNAARERSLELKEATAAERTERANVAYQKKDYATAETEYRELLKADADDAQAHARLASILTQQQRYAEAIAELERAAQLDSKETEVRESLVKLYLLKARDAEAEATARQLLKLTPREASAHHLLARVLLRDTEKLNEALSEVEAALKEKETPHFLETKIYILLARGSKEEALKLAERAVKLERSKAGGPRAALAVALFRLERIDEAVATYNELRRADKNDHWGDIRWLELQRGYSKPVLETLSALIARTN